MFYQLPQEILNLIYSYDATYYLKNNELLLNLKSGIKEFKKNNKKYDCKICNVRINNLSSHYNSILHNYNIFKDDNYLIRNYELMIAYLYNNNINIIDNWQYPYLFRTLNFNNRTGLMLKKMHRENINNYKSICKYYYKIKNDNILYGIIYEIYKDKKLNIIVYFDRSIKYMSRRELNEEIKNYIRN